jgi:hypothetical protein
MRLCRGGECEPKGKTLGSIVPGISVHAGRSSQENALRSRTPIAELCWGAGEPAVDEDGGAIEALTRAFRRTVPRTRSEAGPPVRIRSLQLLLGTAPRVVALPPRLKGRARFLRSGERRADVVCYLLVTEVAIDGVRPVAVVNPDVVEAASV